MMSCFLYNFQVSFISFGFDSLITMHLGVSLFKFSYLNFMELLEWIDCFSSNLGEILAIISSCILSALSLSPPGILIVCMLACMMVSHKSLLNFLSFFLSVFQTA